MDRGAWWTAVHGLKRVGHDWATNAWLLTYCLGSCYSPLLAPAPCPLWLLSPALYLTTCSVCSLWTVSLSPPRSSHFLYSNENFSPGVPCWAQWNCLIILPDSSSSLSVWSVDVSHHPTPLPLQFTPYSLLPLLLSCRSVSDELWFTWEPLTFCVVPYLFSIFKGVSLSCYFLESNRLPEVKYFSVEFWKAVVKNFSVGKRINTPSD